MRLTVGPLPSAVYWRRRAAVLGSLLLVSILLVYSCGGPDGPEGPDITSPSGGDTPATPVAPTVTGSEASTGAIFPPIEAQSSAAPAQAGPDSSQPAGAPPVIGAPAVPAGNLCTDDEMVITPEPASRQLPRNTAMSITLKIRNKSTDTCSRDVGADQQELYLKQGAQKIWSSDDCGGQRGIKVESFASGFERSYTVTWNGRASTTCGTPDSRPIPNAGEYQLYGRLGIKHSDPVTITLT